MSASPARHLWTVVLAGGDGVRLRQLTRALHGEERPKQFAMIHGGRSLLQATVARAARWSAPEHIVVVVAEERESLARMQLREYGGVDVVAQPTNRGTGPGLLLPLSRVFAVLAASDLGWLLTSSSSASRASSFIFSLVKQSDERR